MPALVYYADYVAVMQYVAVVFILDVLPASFKASFHSREI